MSTKIYNAYRIPKDVDILKKLKKIKELARDVIANEGGLLELIHHYVISVAKEEYEKDPQNNAAKYALNENEKGKFDEYWAEMVLEKENLSPKKLLIDIHFECSVFYGNRYWYIKFFPNNSIHYKLLENIEDLGFEDFHYQNQGDPLDDIPYEEYQKRGDIWEILLESSGGNYRDGFLYTIFDAHEFRQLISKNHYTGNPLYEHLSYDFEKKITKITLKPYKDSN